MLKDSAYISLAEAAESMALLGLCSPLALGCIGLRGGKYAAVSGFELASANKSPTEALSTLCEVVTADLCSALLSEQILNRVRLLSRTKTGFFIFSKFLLLRLFYNLHVFAVSPRLFVGEVVRQEHPSASAQSQIGRRAVKAWTAPQGEHQSTLKDTKYLNAAVTFVSYILPVQATKLKAHYFRMWAKQVIKTKFEKQQRRAEQAEMLAELLNGVLTDTKGRLAVAETELADARAQLEKMQQAGQLRHPVYDTHVRLTKVCTHRSAPCKTVFARPFTANPCLSMLPKLVIACLLYVKHSFTVLCKANIF